MTTDRNHTGARCEDLFCRSLCCIILVTQEQRSEGERERKCSAIGSLRGFLFFIFLSKHSNEHNKLAFLPLSPFLEKPYHCQRFNVHLGLSFIFQKGICFIQKRNTSNIQYLQQDWPTLPRLVCAGTATSKSFLQQWLLMNALSSTSFE